MKFHVKHLLWLCLIGLLCVQLNFAQTIYGSVSGVVTDQAGAVVSGANLKVKNLETGQTRDATTNADGMYRVPALATGRYSVKVEKSGFQAQLNERIEISVGVDATANFRLSTATVQEVVTVTETAALLETTQSQVSKVVTSQQILELPGRNNLNGLSPTNRRRKVRSTSPIRTRTP